MATKLLSAPEVAGMLGVELDTLYRYARSGRIRGLKLGKLWRFAEPDVDAFVQSRRFQVAPDPSQVVPRLLTDLFRSERFADGSHGAVISGVNRVFYSDIDVLADRLAQALMSRGVVPGDRVFVALPNSVDFLVACAAIWKLHGIVIPDYPSLKAASLWHILGDARPSAMIVAHNLAEQLEDLHDALPEFKAIFVKDRTFTLTGTISAPVESLDAVLGSDPKSFQPLPEGATPTDVVSITYTSGSTGPPKGVMQTHESWLAGAEFTRDYVGLTSRDVMVVPLPLHHGLAFRQLLAYILADATVIIASDIYQALKLLREQKPTALVLVPAAANITIDHFSTILREVGAGLRYVEVGSAAFPPERLVQLQELLPTTQIHLPYGLTEARVGYLTRAPDGLLNRIGSVAPGLELNVIDSNGAEVAQGQCGELVLRGRGLMKGYWGRSEAEIRSMNSNGFRTGDMGRVEANGDVSLLGRIDEVLKIGGRKVNPLEVEMTLDRHPQVMEAAIVGLANPKGILELELHAFVVLRQEVGTTEADLLDHCREHLELYKVPVKVHFRSSLPKSSVGKLLRHELSA